MISYNIMRKELKRLPKLISIAIKENRLLDAIEMQHEVDTLTWILSDED